MTGNTFSSFTPFQELKDFILNIWRKYEGCSGIQQSGNIKHKILEPFLATTMSLWCIPNSRTNENLVVPSAKSELRIDCAEDAHTVRLQWASPKTEEAIRIRIQIHLNTVCNGQARMRLRGTTKSSGRLKRWQRSIWQKPTAIGVVEQIGSGKQIFWYWLNGPVNPDTTGRDLRQKNDSLRKLRIYTADPSTNHSSTLSFTWNRKRRRNKIESGKNDDSMTDRVSKGTRKKLRKKRIVGKVKPLTAFCLNTDKCQVKHLSNWFQSWNSLDSDFWMKTSGPKYHTNEP